MNPYGDETVELRSDEIDTTEGTADPEAYSPLQAIIDKMWRQAVIARHREEKTKARNRARRKVARRQQQLNRGTTKGQKRSDNAARGRA